MPHRHETHGYSCTKSQPQSTNPFSGCLCNQQTRIVTPSISTSMARRRLADIFANQPVVLYLTSHLATSRRRSISSLKRKPSPSKPTKGSLKTLFHVFRLPFCFRTCIHYFHR
ncbi:hypothetical protein [Kingella sp. (in: b-proteobacteria)]|uniref:hypothetical protein n=1 Tax=Kingella sp. (in: b-proteobacteria) TaxID=2020713 RepID=UPI0026DA7208|nr:hypothetical protein [Kingella sp. (in: b-proteobacteria)]MDO4657530.1 hypothetical protein [Kingella sp. (in: b-proteobacteria)]